jgi:hypothetical protein
MSRRGGILRGAALVLALGLGAAGAWLVITADTARLVRVGTLAGLWGLLIGAFALASGRRAPEPVVSPPPERTYDARLEDILRREIRATISEEMGGLRERLAFAQHVEPVVAAEPEPKEHGPGLRRRRARHVPW